MPDVGQEDDGACDAVHKAVRLVGLRVAAVLAEVATPVGQIST